MALICFLYLMDAATFMHAADGPEALILDSGTESVSQGRFR